MQAMECDCGLPTCESLKCQEEWHMVSGFALLRKFKSTWQWPQSETDVTDIFFRRDYKNWLDNIFCSLHVAWRLEYWKWTKYCAINCFYKDGWGGDGWYDWCCGGSARDLRTKNKKFFMIWQSDPSKYCLC